MLGQPRSTATDRRREVEVEHLGQRLGVSLQTASKRCALPAVHQQAGHALGIGPGRDVAAFDGQPQTYRDPLGDLRKARLDLAPEHLAHSRELLSEPAQQAAQVALLAVALLRRLEEITHAVERARV